MEKTNIVKRFILVLLAIFLIIGQLNLEPFKTLAAENGNEEISYEVEKDLTPDKKKANLKMKVISKNEQVKILSVEAPNGKKTEGSEVLYTAEKNGTLNFLITYQNKEETKSYNASYEVEGISAAGEEADDVEKNQPANATLKTAVRGLKASQPTVTLSIPDYDQKAWSNGSIKDVTATVDFGDDTSSGKKVDFSLPDGMRFMSIPVPSDYQAKDSVDASLLNYLGTSNPLGSAISSVSVPSMETMYNKATYGTVSYNLKDGTEKASFTFSVRVDAAKYYGANDLKTPIKIEAFKGESNTLVATAEQKIHAEGGKVVGNSNQNHVQTMFRNWYPTQGTSENIASTDTKASYNYTKNYTIVTGLNQLDNRGAKWYTPKNTITTLYYPEGMEYEGIVNQNGTLMTSTSNKTITPYPNENKVVIDYKQLNNYGAVDTIFAVKYKIPKGTPAGTYTAEKTPHTTITTYDDEVFETDALTSDASDLTTLAALDTCKVVDKSLNKMSLNTGNKSINPDNETWAGSIQIDNKQTAGVKTNQIYQIEFDPNWQAYTVNMPFDGKIAGNKVKDIQYKTNLNSNFRTYNGTLPKTNSNRMATLDANTIGLEEGEYFTEVKANVGDFSIGFMNTEPSAAYRSASSASYGIVKQGVSSVQFKAAIWDAEDETNTKASGVSTYTVASNQTTMANGTAAFYNKAGTPIKTASAGDIVTTKATLSLTDYPFGTRTVLNNPEIYLQALDGATIHPSSIKLTDQSGKEVSFTLKQDKANNNQKLYIIKTTDTKVGYYVGYPSKQQYLNISYDTSFNVTLQNNINMDIKNVLAWGGTNVTSATTDNCFSDTGLDVNKNGKDKEYLLSTVSSTLNVSKQDTVAVETFLNVAGEGAKATYIEGDDSTVSYFTPGTAADYTVKVTNISDSAANTLELYIPIPKTGEDFGSKFQSEVFKWNMKLSRELTLSPEQQAQFDVSYTTEATADNYESTNIYTDTVSNYEKVNMVKIKLKTQINAGEEQTFKVPLQVDETFDSATKANKTGERDIYNPYYRVITNTFSGSLAGTKVGAELVIAVVSGRLFEDKDANGLYDITKGDEPLVNEVVELYKWNDTSSEYEPVSKDGKNVIAKTDANGSYAFDYNSGVDYGKYAVKFPNKAGYQFTLKNAGTDSSIDSNVNYDGIDKSWVKDIDPTQLNSQYINAGYLKYTPNQDLKVNLNEKLVEVNNNLIITLPKVASTNGIAAEDTIEPDFFGNIQATTDSYSWVTADTAIARAQTLSDGSGSIVGVSTNGKTVAVTNLSITIQDIFGMKQSSTAPFYVTAKDGKVIQRDRFTIGGTDFSLEYKSAASLTEAQALNLAKAAAFEEVKNGVNSNAEDILNSVQVNTAQLSAIQNGSNQGGSYPLTYSVTKDGKSAEIVIRVTVAKDLTAVNAHNSIIYVGDKWNVVNNFDSALDKEGNPIIFSDIQVAGTVNTKIAGTYPITYSYNNVSTTIFVTVKDVQTAVNVHDSVIYTGDSWSAADNFDSAIDKDGNQVTLKDVSITGTVNTKKAGTNDIIYTYDGISTTITVLVKEDKEGVNAHNSSIYVGGNWSSLDNFDSAFDKDGNSVALEELEVAEKPPVDTGKAGSYQVTYSYGKVSTRITVTVKEIQTAVNAHDSVIYTGDSWYALDNFDNARDKDGNPVDYADIQVTGTVDTNKAGTYPVTYSYDGIIVTKNVTVKEPQTTIQAHDSIIYMGDKWTAEDNFDSATDKDGEKVDFKNVTVNKKTDLDFKKPGVYEVTYSYSGVARTVNVTVKLRQTSVKVHDSSIYAGENWSPKDNFNSAKDKQGNSVPFTKVTVTGVVDSTKPGNYEVSYLYDGLKATAHIKVLKNQAQITVKDSTIKSGDTWKAEDNFVQATNRAGEVVSFSQIETKGKVNTNKSGSYQVSYTFDPNEGTANAGREQLKVTAIIKVVDSTTSKPVSTGKLSNSGKNSTATINSQHTTNYLDAKSLPQTGDQSSPWLLWVGICLLGLGTLFIIATRKRK
ncbi:LPXTG cell wall anchor domain-containing protein [Listeria welshimeri]|nr:LPXTG cell wall anchor domain-containing protein [Listeria welshimeri]MBC2313379.1 LPXTG cell wall anchor domain-containing protein [Listeria welshimeri]